MEQHPGRPRYRRQHGRRGVGLRPADVVVSIGTSGTVYGVSDEPTADASGIVAGFADATGRHLPLVCTLNATKVTDACAGCSASTTRSSTVSPSRGHPGPAGSRCSPT